MGTLIKNEFKTHSARQFVESLEETSNSVYYIFMGKPQGYTESTTPTPTNSITNSQYQVCLLYTSPSPRDQRESGVGGCGG